MMATLLVGTCIILISVFAVPPVYSFVRNQYSEQQKRVEIQANMHELEPAVEEMKKLVEGEYATMLNLKAIGEAQQELERVKRANKEIETRIESDEEFIFPSEAEELLNSRKRKMNNQRGYY